MRLILSAAILSSFPYYRYPRLPIVILLQANWNDIQPVPEHEEWQIIILQLSETPLMFILLENKT